MENIPYEEKHPYATHILEILVKNGSANLSDEEKSDYKQRLVAVLDAGF